MLNDRKRKILQIIIEDYIETAEPVGSRTIARKHNLGLSPATIRNEMSDLELLGYLEQPIPRQGVFLLRRHTACMLIPWWIP